MSARPFLRYQFPRELTGRGHGDPEADARRLAALWLALDPRDLYIGRLDAVALEVDIPGRLGYAFGDPMEGAEQLGPWLWLVLAPGRCFLEVDIEGMAEARVEARNLARTRLAR